MNLTEGLRRIGLMAFNGHCFEQTTIPSSVVEIGAGAFLRGEALRKVTLTGVVPSSVVEIGEKAFAYCDNLEAATLAGGAVLVGRNAFFGCRRLRIIATPSEAILVEDGEDGNGRAAVETGGAIARDPDRLDAIGDEAREPTRLVLSSPYLASMNSEDVSRAKDAINRIVGGRRPGEGLLDLAAGGADNLIRVRQGADRIRARFLGLLSAHRREIASILERDLEPGVAETISSFLPDVEG